MSPLAAKPVLHGRDHAPGGADPIPGLLLPGATLQEIILATPDLAGFWPLNETSGDVAHDLSGNSYDLTSGPDHGPPSWGQPAGPPGEPTAGFAAGTAEVLSGFPGLTGDLTFEIWANGDSTFFGQLMNQGSPYDTHSNGIGLMIGSSGFMSGNRPVLFVNNTATGPAALEGDNPVAPHTWVYLACTRAGSLCTLYVNGAAQSTTISPAYTAGSGMYLGTVNPPAGTSRFEGALSYAAAYNRALTASEIGGHYLAATGGTGGTGGGGGGGTTVAADSIWDAKGDLAAGTGPDTAARLPVGSNGQVLTADSTQTTGLKWATAAGGSPPVDTQVWLPLTTVVSGVPELVWDATNSLVPTLTPI